MATSVGHDGIGISHPTSVKHASYAAHLPSNHSAPPTSAHGVGLQHVALGRAPPFSAYPGALHYPVGTGSVPHYSSPTPVIQPTPLPPTPSVPSGVPLGAAMQGAITASGYPNVHAWALSMGIPETDTQPVWYVTTGPFGFVMGAGSTWEECVYLYVVTEKQRQSRNERGRVRALTLTRVESLITSSTTDADDRWSSNHGLLIDELAEDYLYMLMTMQDKTRAEAAVLSLLVEASKSLTSLRQYHGLFSRQEARRAGHEGIEMIISTFNQLYLPRDESEPVQRFYQERLGEQSAHAFLLHLRGVAPYTMTAHQVKRQWEAQMRCEVELDPLLQDTPRQTVIQHVPNAYVVRPVADYITLERLLRDDTKARAKTPHQLDDWMVPDGVTRERIAHEEKLAAERYHYS